MCTRCSLGKNSREKGKPSVVSKGNLHAKLMVIAEAPAREELMMRIPLCGPSGRLWHSMLDEAGIDANKLYQTNCILCQINKTDTSRVKEQLHACAPYLEHQLYVVRPKFLLALGQTAMTRLGAPKDASPLEPNVIMFQYQKLPATWIAHPAYILRQMETRPIYVEKLVKIKELAENSYGIDLNKAAMTAAAARVDSKIVEEL